MVAPHLPDMAIAPLRSVSVAGMRDEMIVELPVYEEYGNGETEIVAWVPSVPIECHMAAAGEEVITWAETRGVRATWAIRCPLELPDILDLAEVPLDARAVIRGGDIEEGTAWQYTLAITADMGRVTRRLHRMLTAVDVELS